MIDSFMHELIENLKRPGITEDYVNGIKGICNIMNWILMLFCNLTLQVI